MRAAIYARVSTKDQSCEMQLRDLRAYCAARGFTIIHEYIDIGQSGAKDSRPELDTLMADARKRKFDTVLVWRFDRFMTLNPVRVESYANWKRKEHFLWLRTSEMPAVLTALRPESLPVKNVFLRRACR